MAFGRKKVQDQEVVQDETVSQDKNLDVSYGIGEELNDDLSITDSIPPPPPNGDVKGPKSEEDSHTLEESPSNEDADSSKNEKKEKKLIKRKKCLLIASCIISFFVLLGLAIKYSKVRNQSNTNTMENESLDSSEIESSSTPSPNTQDIVLVQETAAPTIRSTPIGTPSNTNNGTSVFNPFAECVANEISVVTTCTNNAGAAASMSFCVVDDVTDQFWAWVSTPPQTPPIIANDWAWMEAAAAAEINFLPEGRYEIGLYSNGDEVLDEYPLIGSTSFIVNCRQ